MLQIDNSKIRWLPHEASWSFHRIDSADGICPHCKAPSSFRAQHCNDVKVRTHYVSINEGSCVRCQDLVDIFTISPTKISGNPGCKSAWIFPGIKGLREPKFTSGEIPLSHLSDSYEEAVKCYQNELWRATVTECGRALEIISKDKFPSDEERKRLGKLGQDIGKDFAGSNETVPRQLFEPIISLTQAIRLGRQSGAHFDFTKPADKEVASQLLDMLEYAIEYFYLLPEHIKTLKSKLEKLEL